MTANKHIALVTIATLALAVPGLGDTKHPVARQVEGYFIAHWEISLADYSAQTTQTGIASHIGSLVLEGNGVFNPETGTFFPLMGSITVPNGDQFFWHMEMIGEPPTPVSIVTGGTGRFEGITGAMSVTWQSEPTVTVDPVAGIMTIDLCYTGAGELTY